MKTKLQTLLLVIFCLLQFITSVVSGNEVESKFIAAGLVDVHSVDDSILVDLVNSDADKNFFEEDFYQGLEKAYLRAEVARKLSDAQSLLKKKFPECSLLILDAARPRSVSRKMYEKLKGTQWEKFVANPETGSMHNYGIAVDITIVDGLGEELDMGFTPFRKSRLELYWAYLKKKMGFDLTDEQKKNRELLKRVMISSGFFPLSHEWWHFNGMSKKEARKRYSIIE